MGGKLGVHWRSCRRTIGVSPTLIGCCTAQEHQRAESLIRPFGVNDTDLGKQLPADSPAHHAKTRQRPAEQDEGRPAVGDSSANN